jgi:hypothetical protein
MDAGALHAANKQFVRYGHAAPGPVFSAKIKRDGSASDPQFRATTASVNEINGLTVKTAFSK